MTTKLSALLALATVAVGNAHVADAFSNLGFPIGNGPAIGFDFTQQVIGWRFTSSLTGSLTGFQAAINNVQNPGTYEPFQIGLYANSASDTLGALLGSFSGLSSGEVSGSAGQRDRDRP